MGICLFESFANQSDFRGVRRLSVRIWDKAVADGNVEQMFGMNIKQEGIEVQGDQVGTTDSWPRSKAQDD
jgi:hypothetical protein